MSAAPLSPETRFRAQPRVRVHDLADEAVLLDLDSGRYFALNTTGRRIWQLLTDGRTLAGTLEILLEEFDAPREVLRADLEALVTELMASGVVVVMDSTD